MSVHPRIIFDRGPTSWGARIPRLPGLFAVGPTREEAERRILAAIPDYLRAVEELSAARKNPVRARKPATPTSVKTRRKPAK